MEKDYEYDKTIYCPHCGNQSTWIEKGEGDYYYGGKYICVKCHTVFFMPIIRPETSNSMDIKIINEIKSYNTAVD